MNDDLNNRLLTHWGRVTHICVSKLSILGSDNGLSPGRRQAIIWTNAELLLIGPWGTNFSEILIEILAFSFKKMRLKVSSAKRRPFWLGLNVLMISRGNNLAVPVVRIWAWNIYCTPISVWHQKQTATLIGFGDNTDLLWSNNVNNQFCQLTTRISYQRGIRRPFKCTGNHTYRGLKNNRGMQSKNGLQNLWGNTVFFILC